MIRGFFYSLILIVVLWGFDHILYNGSYGRAIFKEAKYEIAQWLN